MTKRAARIASYDWICVIDDDVAADLATWNRLSARFPRPRDGPRPRTTFPWLLRSRSSYRQYSARAHRIAQGPHRPWPILISTRGRAPLLARWTESVIISRASEALPVRARTQPW